MAVDNEEIIRRFCEAWSRRNADELIDYFADDAVYHNMPMPPVSGKPAILAVWQQFIAPSQSIEWENLHVASRGDVVFTERIDRYVMGDRQVELPVAGVFELKDGKIKAWRDYFDMATWARQTSG